MYHSWPKPDAFKDSKLNFEQSDSLEGTFKDYLEELPDHFRKEII